MADDLARWLERLGLGKYAEILAEHEVSVRDLPHLTEDDLKDLGLPLGPRRRLLAAVKSGNEETDFRLDQIAYLIGYSEPAALVRAFKRWTGNTPMVFREQHR